jgi:hypothetical protein
MALGDARFIAGRAGDEKGNFSNVPMSADVRVGSISEVGARNRLVRFPPDSDRTADIPGSPVRARLGNGAALVSHWAMEVSLTLGSRTKASRR